jgi:protein-S-isoprenylcysteine O-methyltransferase Ste14
LGALVGLGVLIYLLLWQEWQLVHSGRVQVVVDMVGVGVALGGHLVRVWALSYIGSISRTIKLKADRLVQEGPYALVRHPLYLGNWLIAFGLFIICRDAFLLAVGPLFVLGWYLKISAEEEKFLKERFGAEFEEYKRTVPRLFPSVRRICRRTESGVGGFNFLNALGVWFKTKEYQALIGTGLFVIFRELIEAVTQ